MPKRTAAPPAPAPPTPAPSADDGWDSPEDHDNGVPGSASGATDIARGIDLHDKQAAAQESQAHRATAAAATPSVPATPSTPAPLADNSQTESLNARIRELEAQLADAKQAPQKRPPLALNLPEGDQYDPEFKKALTSFADAANQRIADLEKQLETRAAKLESKLGAVEGEHQLNQEERRLTGMLDALPSDNYRAVFEGDDANDNYRAAAAEVQSLREFDKSKNRKRSDEEYFRLAAINLFTDKAESIRAKGGRPRKDRTMNRANSPVNPPAVYGVLAAKQALRNRMAEFGNAALDLEAEEIGYE